MSIEEARVMGREKHVKSRLDINVTSNLKQALDEIIQAELAEDRRNDRPERSRSVILEMVLWRGVRVLQKGS